MRSAVILGSIVLAAAAIAGCKGGGGGGGSPVPTPTSSSGPGGQNLVYVANAGGASVTAYLPLQTSPYVTISGGIKAPVALAVDSSRNLYVANCQPCLPNVGTYSAITKYPAGTTSPSLTITSGINEPESIAVDGKGNLYVANFGSSSVTVYAPGSTSPALTITNAVQSPSTVAVDSSGNIYVANTPSGQTYVTVYTSSGSLVRQIFVSGIESIALDSNANLYVSSCLATCNVNANPDSVTVYGANSSTIEYTISNNLSFPTKMAFDGSGNLYVANDSQGTINDVSEFKAGSGTLLASINAPGPSGIAVDGTGIVYVSDGYGPAVQPYNMMTEYQSGTYTTVTNGISLALAVATTTTPKPSSSVRRR